MWNKGEIGIGSTFYCALPSTFKTFTRIYHLVEITILLIIQSALTSTHFSYCYWFTKIYSTIPAFSLGFLVQASFFKGYCDHFAKINCHWQKNQVALNRNQVKRRVWLKPLHWNLRMIMWLLFVHEPILCRLIVYKSLRMFFLLQFCLCRSNG